MNKQSEYFAIFGGGGVRGISYSGAYKALCESNIKLTGFAGSSIGAVFASLLSLGYSGDEIFDLLANTGLGLFIDINFDITKEISFSKGNIFYEWIKDKIEKKFYKDDYKKGQMRPVCFDDIDSTLVIFSVDLTNLKFKEFSKYLTPDFEIAKAVRASVSMPGLFSPLEIEDTLVVDGDLLKSAPLWRLSPTIKNLEERIIEFRLEDNQTVKNVSNPLEYVNRVYNAISGFATDYIIDLYGQKDKFDYIKINTPNISVVDFLIPKDKKQQLYNIGYDTTKQYFSQIYPYKLKLLLQKYKALSDYMMSFEKELKKSNLITSYLKLCEVFVYLCEEKQFIDSFIYDKICEFKNIFINNYVNKNFFFFKSAKIKNKEEVFSKLDEIINILLKKINEFNP